MSKKAFNTLYDKIRYIEVFVTRRGAKQCCIKFQMIVALTRLGLYGNRATNRNLSDEFKISRKVTKHGNVK